MRARSGQDVVSVRPLRHVDAGPHNVYIDLANECAIVLIADAQCLLQIVGPGERAVGHVLAAPAVEPVKRFHA
ncbi:hypothetical protein CATMQ487_28660 [Sphaerotilus microaerophilus]|uniref:Uncharacterized protein n=1 Tax=Sphaerotilus microaerophilus TaxID=2914710 RepID=A0ABM7YN47_9BURK|nr:hypothetical protein CATMQ487_28660 [Sphaerotilus sp. FB-5]